ncbi:MAG: MinD/ParA family protein [Gammaproteobacteria bacterium]
MMQNSQSSGGAVRVIAVSSGKGGVGKTNVSVNLALALAQEGQQVLLMDADLGMANVDVMLNIRPQYDLYHVITGQKTLDEVIIQGPLGVGIIPAASGVGRMADLSPHEHAGLIAAFDEIAHRVDTLVVDTAAGISDSVVSFSRAAQEIIVVVCDEPASITDAYALIKVLSLEHGIRRFQILANMVSDAEHGRRLYARLANVAGSFLDVSLGYVGAIPLDDRLKQAVRQQSPVLLSFPHSASGVAFQQLGKRIKGLPRLPAASGHLGFFIERTSMAQTASVGGVRT